METASRFGSKPTLYPSPTENDVSIEIVMDGTGPRIGGDAKLSIVLKNTSSKQRTASLLYEVMVMYYTGVLKDTVKKDRIPIDLKPQESEWSLTIKQSQSRLFSGYCASQCLNHDETCLQLAFNFIYKLNLLSLKRPSLCLTCP